MSDLSRPLPAPLPALPLLASLVQGAPEDFFDALVGRLQRLLHEQKAAGLSSDAVGQVLRALLHHDGWHSNRVWAGVPCLSQVAGVGERTVRRVLGWLRKMGMVREVTGEELYRGPGPHEWPAEKRRGRLETTFYDLSGLAALIPAAFRKAVSALWADKADRTEAADASCAVLLPGESEAPALLPPLPDPFADPAAPPELSSPSLPPFMGTKQTPSCLVSGKQGEPGKAEKRPSPPTLPSPFTRPDLAAIRIGGKSEPGRQKAPEEESPRLAPGDEATAFRGLRGQKVSPTIARRILKEKGPRWCLTLLAYGRWTRRRKSVGPGWFVAVWQQSDDTWPDDFLNWYAKERAHAGRAKESRKPLLPSAVLVRPHGPAPVKAVSAVSAVAVKALLAGLTDGERAALEAQAKAELRAETGRAPVPPLVRSRVLLLLARQQFHP